MFEEFVKMMNSKGYEVVPQYEGIQGIDYGGIDGNLYSRNYK